MESTQEQASGPSFALKLVAIIFSIILFLIVWKASDVFFIIFAGVLFATFLQTFGLYLAQILKISYTKSLSIVIAILFCTLVTFVLLFAPTVLQQLSALVAGIPRGLNYLQDLVQSYFQNHGVEENNFSFHDLVTPGLAILTQVPTIFSTTLGTIVSLTVVFFIGVYFAFDYSSYICGFLKLIPKDKQIPTERVLHACISNLRSWLLGQFIAMIFVFIATTIGLWIIGSPLAFTLGLLAGILTFLPAIGSFLSAIPAVLIVLVKDVNLAIYVAILYTVVHIIEGYFITPYIQQRTTSLPPALVIISQILLSVLAGFWGLLMAAPLLAVGMIIVNKIYIEEIVEKK